MSPMMEKVRQTIKRYGLIAKGDKVLVGVSGGPDSVALLFALYALFRESGFSLHVAHLDHMLRRGSASDAEFVKRLAGKLRVPVTVGRANILAHAKKGSPEEIARVYRQQFLFKVAKKVHADKIALGHTLDDQAETVLMRILRGTGLYGLAGILPKRTIRRRVVIRPLLDVRRREIEAFLKRGKVKPRIDASNADDAYFRNRIRNTLLPLLEARFNKNIKEVLSNLAESAGFDYAYLLGVASRTCERMGSRLRVRVLLKLHPAVRRLVLRLGIAKVQGDTRRITFRHLREIEDLLFERPVNSVVDLPKGISVVKKKAHLLVYKR